MDTDALIQQEFDKLPLDIKEALGRVDWRGKVSEIAKTHGLDADKSEALEMETMFILFGILNADSYLGNLQSEVGLDPNTAAQIKREVEEKVFAEVEKQYEVVSAQMPKVEKIVPVQNKPQNLEVVQNKIIEAPENLPMMTPESVVKVVEPSTVAEAAPKPIPTPHEEPAKEVFAPITRPTDDLNLITDRPSSDARPDKPTITAPTSYPTGKDPYREPLD